jgi:osmotically-inducible protein OsmY
MRPAPALVLTAILAVGSPALAQTTTTAPNDKATSQRQAQTDPGRVTIGQRTVFKLAPLKQISGRQRAEAASGAILAAITPEPGNTVVKAISLPDDVQTKEVNGLQTVTFKGKHILTVTKPDVDANGISADVLAGRWAQELRDALASLDITARTAFQAVRPEITVAGTETGTETASNPDEQLVAKVRKQLQQDSNLRNHPIGVQAKDGAVTLRGMVPDQKTEDRAIEAARKVPGVDSVRSDLRIQGQ